MERAATLLTVMPRNQLRKTIESLLAPHDLERGRQAVDALIDAAFAVEDETGHLRRMPSTPTGADPSQAALRRATLGWPSMIAVLGGLGAAFAWATTMICATRAARLIGATSVLAWVMLIGLVLTLPWALIRGVPEVDGNATRWLILAGVGNCVGLLLVYTGVRVGKVGVVAPIVSTEGAIAALIAVAAGEQLAPGTGAALVVIAVGIVLAAASRDSSGSGSRTSDIRAALFGAAAAVSFGASLYATGRVSAELPVAWAILPPRIVGVVAIALPLAIAATPDVDAPRGAVRARSRESQRWSGSRSSCSAHGTGSP